MLRYTMLAGLAVLAVAPPVVAQKGDTTDARQIAPGVTYRRFVKSSGPFIVHVIRVDLRRKDVEVRAVRAHDALRGREKPTDMAHRLSLAGDSVLAAVNADFFELKSGENENEQVIGGEWWKGLKVTDSPYDTYDNVHTQFALDQRNRPYMDRFILDGAAWRGTVPTPIIDVNFNPSGKPEGTALYTSRYGAATPVDTSRQTAEAPLVVAARRGDTVLFVRTGPVSSTSGSVIPANGAVLAAYGAGARQTEVRAMTAGDTIRVLLRTLPRLGQAGHATPAVLIGGWPRILTNGVVTAADASTLEGTISRNAEMRHPRTAIGFSRDSTTLYLVAVDGRSEDSGGMTLLELAAMMKSLGAWQAMNFDGGGSTTMLVGGKVVNAPSDTTGERDVGNALMIVRKR